MNIQKMTIEELVAAEKAAGIVRKMYEDKISTYQVLAYHPEEGTKEFSEYQELSKKLALFNAVRLKIISEMENRLTNIE